uniref:Uncharacterized protein n=1 Tax=Lactuca sativa TaxID=4236 RepID=A0A9R1WD65_LACSA|nr:hypothetical protein LSAT_V11C200068620 [Lactuca sativa]
MVKIVPHYTIKCPRKIHNFYIRTLFLSPRKPGVTPGPFHSLGPNDKLIVNQMYNTKKELAFVVKFEAIREKFQLKVEKSSKSRYQVVCMQENRHWRLYTSLIKGT